MFKVSGLKPLLRTSASFRPQHDIASRLPSEILAKIFDLTLNVMDRSHYNPHHSLVPFATVNKWWSDIAHYLLYRSISVNSSTYSTNVPGMLRQTLSADPQIAARVIELRVAVDEDRRIQDFFALFDLCVNLKHVDIFGYQLHSLQSCRRVLAQRNLISIHIRMDTCSSLKDPAFCSTGCLLEMMQGWPDLEKLHISHITSSAHTTHVRNNCCPRLKVIHMCEGEFSADLLLQLPRITQAVERLHLRTAWVYEFPASSVFFAIRAWQNSLKWLHYAPKRRLDVHPSQHPHLPHLKYFETNSTGLPASYLRVVSPNVSTLRYMATLEDFHHVTTNLYDLTFLPSLALLYISPLPDWTSLSSHPKFPEDDVQSLETICVQRSIELIFQFYP